MRNLLIASTIAAALLGSTVPQAFAGAYEAWGHTFTTAADAPFAAAGTTGVRAPGDGFQALAPRHRQRHVSLPSGVLGR